MERPWLERRENLSRQEMFDIVWNHFVVEKHPQNFTVVDEIATPVYGGDGHYCAAGLFLADEECKKADEPAFSGLGGYDIQGTATRLGLQLGADFLLLLQRCHDHNKNLLQMEADLRWIAERYELEVPGDA